MLCRSLAFALLYLLWTPATFAAMPSPAPLPKASLLELEPPLEALAHEVIELRPKSGHHFNLEAPNSCHGREFLTKQADRLECQLGKRGEERISLFICDDAKSFCRQEDFLVKIRGGAPIKSKTKLTKRKSEPSSSERASLPDFGFDVAQGLRQAKQKKQPLLIVYSGPNCPPCAELKEKVFPKAEWKAATKKFVKIYADASLRETHEQLGRYSLYWTPTLLILNSQAEEIGRMAGYYPIDDYLADLERRTKYLNTPIARAIAQYEAQKKQPDAFKDPKFAELAERVGVWFSTARESARAVEALAPLKEISPDARSHLLVARMFVAEDEKNFAELGKVIDTILDDPTLSPKLIGWIGFYLKYVLKTADPKLTSRLANRLIDEIRKMKKSEVAGKYVSKDRLLAIEGNAYELLQNKSEARASYQQELETIEKLIDQASSESAKLDLEFSRVYILKKMGKDFRAKRAVVALLERGEGRFEVLESAFEFYQDLEEFKVATEINEKMAALAVGNEDRSQQVLLNRVRLHLKKKEPEAAKKLLQQFFSELSLPPAGSAWIHARVKQARKLDALVKEAIAGASNVAAKKN